MKYLTIRADLLRVQDILQPTQVNLNRGLVIDTEVTGPIKIFFAKSGVTQIIATLITLQWNIIQWIIPLTKGALKTLTITSQPSMRVVRMHRGQPSLKLPIQRRELKRKLIEFLQQQSYRLALHSLHQENNLYDWAPS
jgi:hypothetical protein